uniref:Uncharacterized protein n=1 Tax=Oryza sativa subsp. japonica TaxID=39947 RepID=Q6EPR0_ORYSJ|nr:hypothetical protein [Oryza sativa Japonica Group]BAD29360.1 hypothetical protein [Oryza sativa Japonica Group]
MRSPPPTRVARRGGVPRGSSDAGEKWKALVREGSEAAALEMCRRRHRGERRRSCDRRRHLCRRPQRPPPAHATVSDGVGGGEATDTTPTRSGSKDEEDENTTHARRNTKRERNSTNSCKGEARSPLLGVATAAAAAASLARRSGSAETPRSKPRRASTYTAAADWDEPASPDDDAKFDATMAAPLRTRPRRRQQPPEDDRHWNASGRGAGDGARRSYPIPSPAT